MNAGGRPGGKARRRLGLVVQCDVFWICHSARSRGIHFDKIADDADVKRAIFLASKDVGLGLSLKHCYPCRFMDSATTRRMTGFEFAGRLRPHFHLHQRLRSNPRKSAAHIGGLHGGNFVRPSV